MKAYLTFQRNRGWHFHLLSADCGTALTPWKRAGGPDAGPEALLGIIARLKGDAAIAKHFNLVRCLPRA